MIPRRAVWLKSVASGREDRAPRPGASGVEIVWRQAELERVAQPSVARTRFVAQCRLVDEAEASRNGRAARIQGVAANAHALCLQGVERERGEERRGLGDVTAAFSRTQSESSSRFRRSERSSRSGADLSCRRTRRSRAPESKREIPARRPFRLAAAGRRSRPDLGSSHSLDLRHARRSAPRAIRRPPARLLRHRRRDRGGRAPAGQPARPADRGAADWARAARPWSFRSRHFALISATVVSSIRFEKPHSLSYQLDTLTSRPDTLVSVESNVEDAGSWLKSTDTSGPVL